MCIIYKKPKTLKKQRVFFHCWKQPGIVAWHQYWFPLCRIVCVEPFPIASGCGIKKIIDTLLLIQLQILVQYDLICVIQLGYPIRFIYQGFIFARLNGSPKWSSPPQKLLATHAQKSVLEITEKHNKNIQFLTMFLNFLNTYVRIEKLIKREPVIWISWVEFFQKINSHGGRLFQTLIEFSLFYIQNERFNYFIFLG